MDREGDHGGILNPHLRIQSHSRLGRRLGVRVLVPGERVEVSKKERPSKGRAAMMVGGKALERTEEEVGGRRNLAGRRSGN